jgi:hypothetical protein
MAMTTSNSLKPNPARLAFTESSTDGVWRRRGSRIGMEAAGAPSLGRTGRDYVRPV